MEKTFQNVKMLQSIHVELSVIYFPVATCLVCDLKVKSVKI